MVAQINKCDIRKEQKERNVSFFFQEAFYSAMNSNNPHSSLHVVTPLMFWRYHCITDIYELSQLIFSPQCAGRHLQIYTEISNSLQTSISSLSPD